MIIYEIDYNKQDDKKLKEIYSNWKWLEQFNLPKYNLTKDEVDYFFNYIPPRFLYQFIVRCYDMELINEYGIPEMIYKINLEEWKTNKNI